MLECEERVISAPGGLIRGDWSFVNSCGFCVGPQRLSDTATFTANLPLTQSRGRKSAARRYWAALPDDLLTASSASSSFSSAPFGRQ